MSRRSSVGVVTRLWSVFSIPGTGEGFIHPPSPRSGAHPASYSVGSGGSVPGG